MDFDLPFGFSLTNKKGKSKQEEDNSLPSLPEQDRQDGALEINGNYGVGGSYGVGFGLDYQTPEDEVKLITKYRELAAQPEFKRAIDDIVNEAFSYEDETYPVKVSVKNEKVNDGLKKKISDEFENIMRMMNFNDLGYEIFFNWYVDGRIYYQKIIDPTKPKDGMKQIKYLDPRKIKKVRKKLASKKKNSVPTQQQGIDLNAQYEEFYIYNPSGISSTNPTGIKVPIDSIVYVHSGLFSKDNKTVLSYIHQAIRYFNALRNLEDAVVIYRLTRAPERRVFNVEVGNLPPAKAQERLDQMINRFRKKLSYDPTTGDVLEQKRYTGMQEDFWFAKRDGVGSTVDTLAGGQTLGQMDDVEYFKKKLYESLNVPITRMDSSNTFNMGRSSEITRDEIKFAKFISRLRKRFSGLFLDLLKTQLVLKGITSLSDFEEIENDIVFDFIEDNNFAELKSEEIWNNRFNTLNVIDNFVGKYVTEEWVQREILHFSDEEISDMAKKLAEERKKNDELGMGDDDGSDQQPDQPEEPETPDGSIQAQSTQQYLKPEDK